MSAGDEEISSEALITTEEAAFLLGIKPATLRSWIRKRKIPFVKVGKLNRFSRGDIAQWIDQNRHMPEPRA